LKSDEFEHYQLQKKYQSKNYNKFGIILSDLSRNKQNRLLLQSQIIFEYQESISDIGEIKDIFKSFFF
jgi:hypothetical protein